MRKFKLNKLKFKLSSRQGYSPSLYTTDQKTPVLKHWDQLKTAILQTSGEVAGFTTKKNKDGFDENNKEI
jgi:hypothetical protein